MYHIAKNININGCLFILTLYNVFLLDLFDEKTHSITDHASIFLCHSIFKTFVYQEQIPHCLFGERLDRYRQSWKFRIQFSLFPGQGFRNRHR